jgi:hypothetical protein
MAKTSINPEAPAALVPVNQGPADLPANYNPDAYDDVSRDIEVPVLGLINNVGPLAKKFKNQGGKFVLGETLLGDFVCVIPVALVKFYRETFRNGKALKYGTPEAATAKVFATAQDAAKAGYIVDFDARAQNRVEEAGRVGYLVLAPEGDTSGEFTIKLGSNFPKVAQAKCSYQRGGYRAVMRRIFDAAAKKARADELVTAGMTHSQLFSAAKPWTHIWTVTSESVEGNENAWYEPRIARGEHLPDDVIAKITAEYGTVTA